MKKKQLFGRAMMLGVLVAPLGLQIASVSADTFYQNQTSAQAADITNWIASTPEQIKNNIASQNINPNQLDGETYIIQWGDTLWGISQATGISIEKLAYDNNIQNIDLIYAGDTLILRRTGEVPVDYRPTGNGHQCAQTKVVINNHYGDNNSVIINNSTFMAQNYSNTTTVYAPDNSDTTISFANTSNNSNETTINNNTSSESSTSSSENTASNSSSSSSNASSSSSSESAPSSSSATNSSSAVKQLERNDFLNKVQDDFNELYREEEAKGYSEADIELFDFVPYTDSTEDNLSEFDKNNLYKDTDINQTVTSLSKDKAMTDENAKLLAKEILGKLRKDNKIEDLKKANRLQVVLSNKDNLIRFNVTLYHEKVAPSSSVASSSSSTRPTTTSVPEASKPSSSYRSNAYDSESSSSSSQSNYSDSSRTMTESSETVE